LLGGKLRGQEVIKKCIYKYIVENGLSSNNVRSIYQDKFGFVWISTQDGLNRFDGERFVEFNSSAPPPKKTLGIDFRAACQDHNSGLIWALNSVNGLNAIDLLTEKVVKTVLTPEYKKDDWNITMSYATDHLWVGSNHGIKAYNIQQAKWEQTPALPFKINKRGDLFAVRTLYVDHAQRVWAFVNHYGLVLLDSRQNRLIDVLPQEQLGSSDVELTFTSAMELGPDTLLVGSSEGLKMVCAAQDRIRVISDFTQLDKLKKARISAITKTSKHVFVGTEKGLLQCDLGLGKYSQIKEVSVNGEEWFNTIQHLYTDSEDNVWIGCKEGLAYLRTNQSPFERINQQEYPEAKLNQVYCVKPVENDFLIGMEKGLVRYIPSQNRFQILEEKMAYNYAFYDHDSNLIVSSNDGLFVLKRDSLLPAQQVHPEIASFSGSYVNSVVALGDSVWAIGSDDARGIFLWNYNRK